MTKSTKHWYPRYCGDYGQKTKHLSLLEHGAYTLLLDHYYSTEKPIPANALQVHRVCMAFAQEEHDAVQSVLDQFFVLTENGYINKRVEEELEKRRDISEKRKKAAEARHNNNDANAVQVHSKCNANGYTSTSTSTSTSITNIKKKNKNKKEKHFEEFWEKYPRQRRGAKAKAEIAYKNALERDTPENIFKGLLKYADSDEVAKGYAKGAAAWLNDDRWLNDYSAGKAQQEVFKPREGKSIMDFDGDWSKYKEYLQQQNTA